MSIFSGGFWNWCRSYTNGVSFEQQEYLGGLITRVMDGEATEEDWKVIRAGSDIPVVQKIFELLIRLDETCNPIITKELRLQLSEARVTLKEMNDRLNESAKQIKMYQEKCATLTARAERSQEQIDTLLAVIEHQSLMLGFNVPASLQSKMPSKN